MALFEFLRLSLSVPTIGPLDNSSKPDPSDNREDYIRFLFSERHEFFFRRSLFSYVPVHSSPLPDGVLAGYIGRQSDKLEAQGPDQLFALALSKKWNAAFLVVDTIGQIVAIEKKSDVGESHRVVEHLIESRSKDYRKISWHVDTEYISSTQEFFSVVETYLGRITELSFTFHPPNGLKGFDEFKRLDKIGKDQTNAEKSEYSLKNKGGELHPKGDFVESALDYANQGAGLTKLKVGKKVVYNSRDHKESLDVAEDLMPREGEEIKVAGAADYVLKWLRSRLTRKKKIDQ